MDLSFKSSVLSVIKTYQASNGFTARKITDTPTGGYQVTSRHYVNLNGTTALRPTSSVTGQFYFDTSKNIPVWWNGSTWVNASGTPS